MKALELQNINIDHYTIGAQFSRTTHAKGGVVIYTHNSLHPAAINLSTVRKRILRSVVLS